MTAQEAVIGAEAEADGWLCRVCGVGRAVSVMRDSNGLVVDAICSQACAERRAAERGPVNQNERFVYMRGYYNREL